MRTIVVYVDYEVISPAVLSSIISADLMGWCWYSENNEDCFEFSVKCREEDAATVERKLAKYL